MSLQPFPSQSLNNDPQLEVFSVTMRCSNADLLALWLILCTQGHEDFLIHCLGYVVHVHVAPCIYLCVLFFLPPLHIYTLLSPNHQF